MVKTILKAKLTLVVIGACVLALMLGCGDGGTSGGVTEANIEQILAGTKSSEADVRSCKYEMTMKMGLFADTTMTGAIDFTGGKAWFDMQMTSLGMEVAAEYYVLGDEMYMKIAAEGETLWLKTEMLAGEGFWDTGNPVEDQQDLLDDGLDYEKLGTEVVRGVECYVLRVEPDTSELWGMMDLDQSFAQDDLADLNLSFWIAKDTFFPMKMEMSMTMEDGSAIEWDMLLYDYNKPVNIQLPPEAGDAVEVTPDQLNM